MGDNFNFFSLFRRREVHLGYKRSLRHPSIPSENETEIKRETEIYSERHNEWEITLVFFSLFRRPKVHLGYERSLRHRSIPPDNKTEIKSETEIDSEKQNK